MFRRVAFSSVSRAYSTRRLFCAPARTYLTATQTCRSFPIFTSVSSSQFGKRWLSAKEQEPVTVQAEPVEAAASSANTAPEANSGKENNVREQETASKQETQPEDPKPLNGLRKFSVQFLIFGRGRTRISSRDSQITWHCCKVSLHRQRGTPCLFWVLWLKTLDRCSFENWFLTHRTLWKN